MSNLGKFKDFEYINKKNYLTLVLGLFFVMIAISGMTYETPCATEMIYNIICMISGFCIIFLINTAMIFPDRKRIIAISTIYFINIVFASLGLLPREGVKSIFKGIDSYDRFEGMLFLLSIALLLLNMSMERVNVRFIKPVATVGIVIFFINKFTIDSYITTSLVLIALFLYSYILLKEYKLFIEDYINYSKANILFLLLISILNIVNRILYYKDTILFLIISIIYISSFTVNCCCFIYKMINDPYKVLFSDIFDKGNEMKELNKTIISKNRELEFSQVVVRKKEQMLKKFFQNVPIPLIILNRQNGRIAFANTNFLRFIGGDNLKKVVNRKLSSIVTMDKKPFIKKSKAGESYIYRGVVEVDGEIKHIDIEFVDGNEHIDDVIVIFNDITSKVKVDSMKETMQNKILEERLKRDFLSNISHDLKTPINVIYSATQLESFFIEKNNIEGLKKYNNVSKQNCISLTRLANNLIDSSRINSDYLLANLEKQNVVVLVEEMVTGLVEYAKAKNVNLIFDTNDEIIYAMLDEDFMQRIILNLVSNAIKFCNENGFIYVVVSHYENKVSIVVRDNGVGMEPEFINEAFDRYSMGKNNDKNSTKGTGIGLFVVKRLVEMQKGSIRVESEIGIGTKFDLIFDKVI